MAEEEINEANILIERIKMLSPSTKLANDVVNYIFLAVNESSKFGNITFGEYMHLIIRNQKGLNKIIYVENFSRDITMRTALSKAASTLIRLLFTQILHGRGYNMKLAEFESRRPIQISR